jgi:membrane-bound lytic murein transglycosylase D
LKELHSYFGDWTTALAAYNCGEFRVQRVIRAQRINYLDNFWDLFLMLPRETARFVPRFIATLLIIKNPQKYGINLPDPDPPVKFDTIPVNHPVRLSTLSQKLGLEKETLASLNPELRYKATPEREYTLKIPLGYKEKTSEEIQKLARWIPPKASYIIHYIRRGETVSGIARRYRTSISAIARMNRLRRNYLIRPGQRLKIPTRGRRRVITSRALKLTKDKKDLIYIVKQGDSLHLIAAAFKTTIKKIKEQNKLRSNILKVGQKLVIQAGVPEGMQVYTVKRGDTPYSISRAYGMKLSTFLKLNRLRSRARIFPGQKLLVLSPDNP